MSNQVILVTAGYDHKVCFWDATRRCILRTLKFGESQVNALAISPNKRYLCAVGNPFVRIWDIESGNQPVTFAYCGCLYQDCDSKPDVTMCGHLRADHQL